MNSEQPGAPREAPVNPIERSIRHSLETYFRDLDGTAPGGLYDMLIRAVEKPLLDVVMHHAGHNQSRAAEWLGLNRNTLRKKLVEHQLIAVDKS